MDGGDFDGFPDFWSALSCHRWPLLVFLAFIDMRMLIQHPCKIGTIAMLVRVHGADKIESGKWVRIQECVRGPWLRVLVERVGQSGYFTASR
jgi:hypothetical protein